MELRVALRDAIDAMDIGRTLLGWIANGSLGNGIARVPWRAGIRTMFQVKLQGFRAQGIDHRQEGGRAQQRQGGLGLQQKRQAPGATGGRCGAGGGALLGMQSQALQLGLQQGPQG